MSGAPMSFDYLRRESKAGRMGARLMAIVAEGDRERVYLSPTAEHENAALHAKPDWKPTLEISHWPGRTNVVEYGMTSFGDLFTPRQLKTLSVFSDLIPEAAKDAYQRASRHQGSEDNRQLDCNGEGAVAYAEAVSIYLAFAVDKCSDYWSSICTWINKIGAMRNTFARQAIPMTWDYAEVNAFSDSTGNWSAMSDWTWKALANVPADCVRGASCQMQAQNQPLSNNKVISTDPPYYDNIGYADLSDFFYVWLRRSLRSVFPDLFATLAVPKAQELVASPYRHEGREGAESFFLNGMTESMTRLSDQAHPSSPITIYYAFKQSETKVSAGTSSTGWETFLDAVISSGLGVSGTWPIRTEFGNRPVSEGANALASSIVLVCYRRSASSPLISRNEFRRELRLSLPKALKELEHANIAPVDVAQSAIGPGMAIFTSAKAVLNPDDSPMSVREALIEINTALDEYLSQDEGDLDADSRFALTFFESYGYEERPYGDAEGLAIARNLSVDGVAVAGILSSVAGKVQLYQRAQLPDDWDPTTDRRLCVWEATQHLIKRLEASGEGDAAELLLQLKNVSGHGDLAANCRALAYRLYNHCEKKKQAEEARAYNGLVIAWPELERLASASSTNSSAPRQTTLI
ncbi:DUF1156 domain-containing protein [Synechococcus sp. 8F6]|uniref:DUF1156 domain-containing protein n=1 Tax=Synechococcus sp. 8F6 TaxID=2025606 RepID=UPI00130382D2|nr:hypothetical protein [Synechococcus sp. 8F6]